MGWLIGWRSKEELLKHLDGQMNGMCSCEYAGGIGAGNSCVCAPFSKVVAKSVVGNVLYAVIEKAGERIILVILLTGVGGEWGYKDMDEGMGPCEVSCPLKILAAAGEPPNEYAKAWREKVRAHHAEKSAKRAKAKTNKAKAVYGAKIKLPESFKPNEFTVVGVDGNNVSGLAADGRTYRLGAAALGKAEVL